jgi:hypothetical protein
MCILDFLVYRVIFNDHVFQLVEDLQYREEHMI